MHLNGVNHGFFLINIELPMETIFLKNTLCWQA